MTFARVLLISGLVAAAGLSPALAKTTKALRQQAQSTCLNDATRLCEESIGDEAATTACMKEHKSELSPACLKVFEAAFGK